MASVPFNNLITFSRGSNATLTGSNGLIQYAPNNLVTFSEQFDNALWVKINASVTANTTAAPDGTATADKLIADALNAQHRVQFGTTSAAATYAFSVYLKAAGYNFGLVRIGTSGGWVNLTDGTVSTVTGGYTMTSTAVGNGWYRVVLVGAAVLNDIVRINVSNADAVTDFAGNGTDGIFVWGAQLELGSAATTYNSTTVKNLLGFSEAFDNAAWTKSNASIVTNAQANPVNGAFNAQKLMENTAAGTHYALQAVSVLAAPYALSVYAKAGERSFASLAFDGLNAWFNLSTGALGTVEAGLTASIVSVGSGWYRCSVFRTVAVAGSKSCVVYPASANGTVSYTGDGNSGIYIYGAQLSDSASLDPYVPTPAAAPSSTAYYGPRFDYDPVTLAPKGLLVEEARTNIILYSQQFGDAAWLKSITTVTENTTVSPDGTANADTYAATASGAGAARQVYQISKTLTAIPYTWSVYAKAKELNWLVINAYDGTNRATYFNLANGTVGTVAAGDTASIQNAGNGWYRCLVTRTAAATANGGVSFELTTGDNVLPINANLTAGFGIFLYGAQMEVGAFATSYIPTVASTVTRSADVATINGSLFSQWYGQSAGTFVVQADAAASGANRVIVGAPTLVFPNYIRSTNQGGAFDTANVAATANVITTDVFKLATTYGSSTLQACLNGGTVVSASYNNIFASLTAVGLGSNAAGGSILNGHIRSVNFIPARAADFQLQALTT